MTSSNGNIFRVTGPLCGEFTGPGDFPAQRPVTRSFDVFFDLRPNKRLSEAGDLRRQRGHYDVIVMSYLLEMTYIFVRCRRSLAKTTFVKYDNDAFVLTD